MFLLIATVSALRINCREQAAVEELERILETFFHDKEGMVEDIVERLGQELCVLGVCLRHVSLGSSIPAC